MTCIRTGIASFGGSFPPEYSMEKLSDNVPGVPCGCCGASASVAVLVVCRGQLEQKLSFWYLIDKKNGVASNLTWSLPLIAG